MMVEHRCIICGHRITDKQLRETLPIAEIRHDDAVKRMPGGKTIDNSVDILRVRQVHQNCWRHNRDSRGWTYWALAPFLTVRDISDTIGV